MDNTNQEHVSRLEEADPFEIRANRKRAFDYEPVTRTGSAQSPDSEINDEIPNRNESPLLQAGAPQGPTKTALAEDASQAPDDGKWLTKRAHLPSYLGLFLFTIAVYVRPYEIVNALAPLRTMAFWIAIATLLVYLPAQLGVEGNLTARPREANLVLLLGLAALLSIPLGDDPGTSWGSFAEYSKVILMFIVMVNAMRTEGRLKGLIFLLLAISCYVSGVALRNYLTGTFEYETYRVGGVGGSMFRNPNDMALHLVTMTPLAIGLFMASRNPVIKLLCALCTLLFVAGVLVSYSRGGLVGLCAAGGMIVWRAGFHKRMSTFVLAAVLAGSLVALAPSGIGGRFSAIFSEGEGGSASARREELKRSILVAARHPLLGIGIGNYLPRSTRSQASHNGYTQMASEMGIPAMIIYIMFMLSPLKRLRRVQAETSGRRRGSHFYYLAVGMQGSLVGYMVCSFFASVAHLWYIYYLVGLSICLARIYDLKMDAANDQEGTKPVKPLNASGVLPRLEPAQAPTLKGWS